MNKTKNYFEKIGFVLISINLGALSGYGTYSLIVKSAPKYMGIVPSFLLGGLNTILIFMLYSDLCYYIEKLESDSK